MWQRRRRGRWGAYWYYVPFFLSGFSALLYQIVWQRALFTLFGVNIESVTVIVTSFMIGLGLGSLAGGRISRSATLPLLGVFGLIEFSIGIFGLISLPLFRQVAVLTAGLPSYATGLVTMGLLLIPTMLMGSTLPLLAAHFVRHTRNVGESVGVLYFVNTCGSAIACFAAALVVMARSGESGTVHLAVGLNVLVGAAALLGQRLVGSDLQAADVEERHAGPSHAVISLPLGLVLAAACGFISLAYEIVWYRLYAFTSGDAAASFALLLGAYLAGIAFGSLGIRDLSRRTLSARPDAPMGLLTNLIIWAGIVSFLVAPILAMTVHQFIEYQKTMPLIALASGLLGASFPLLSHAAIEPGDDSGAHLSYLYLANILGSAAGSFTVGFILMDRLSLQRISALLLATSLMLAVLLMTRGASYGRRLAVAGAACAVALIAFTAPLYGHLYERLLFKERFTPFQYLVENRNGVIAVTPDGTVYGGGVYDGRYNTDLIHDTNGIYRVFALSALPNEPRDVLVVGLSTGSWAQVIANHPTVKHVTIVEINPGYLQLIPRYPAVASLLKNPKVRIVVDDGRRWLVRNPEAAFDLAVMNTSVHGRANSTNVLSVEFLQLVRRHLKPGGVHYFNTTWSEEAFNSGVRVFPYALRISSFLAVSDSPIRLDRELWKQRLTHYTIDGTPVLNLADPRQRQVLDGMLAHVDGSRSSRSPASETFELGDALRRRLTRAGVITDDNMGSEWR